MRRRRRNWRRRHLANAALSPKNMARAVLQAFPRFPVPGVSFTWDLCNASPGICVMLHLGFV